MTKVAILAAVSVGAVGVARMLWAPTAWGSHCAHRYCDRLPGPALDRSPFPVDVDCAALFLCVNEHGYSEDERRTIDELLGANGCERP